MEMAFLWLHLQRHDFSYNCCSQCTWKTRNTDRFQTTLPVIQLNVFDIESGFFTFVFYCSSSPMSLESVRFLLLFSQLLSNVVLTFQLKDTQNQYIAVAPGLTHRVLSSQCKLLLKSICFSAIQERPFKKKFDDKSKKHSQQTFEGNERDDREEELYFIVGILCSSLCVKNTLSRIAFNRRKELSNSFSSSSCFLIQRPNNERIHSIWLQIHSQRIQ